MAATKPRLCRLCKCGASIDAQRIMFDCAGLVAQHMQTPYLRVLIVSMLCYLFER